MEQLRGYGLDPHPCGHGVIAELGQEGGRTILLRADMDALPMPEESGESFSCPTGTEAHTCGHDFHAAMLLTAAKILKENDLCCLAGFGSCSSLLKKPLKVRRICWQMEYWKEWMQP